MKANKPRKFVKFVALDERGNPLWGTLETTPEEAQERHDRFNPDPTGQGCGETIYEVEMLIKSMKTTKA